MATKTAAVNRYEKAAAILAAHLDGSAPWRAVYSGEGKVVAYLIPASSGPGYYRVNPVRGTCTCPDHGTRGAECKHLISARTFRVDKLIEAAGDAEKASREWEVFDKAETARILEILTPAV